MSLPAETTTRQGASLKTPLETEIPPHHWHVTRAYLDKPPSVERQFGNELEAADFARKLAFQYVRNKLVRIVSYGEPETQYWGWDIKFTEPILRYPDYAHVRVRRCRRDHTKGS
jgi:hypothetical protein